MATVTMGGLLEYLENIHRKAELMFPALASEFEQAANGTFFYEQLDLKARIVERVQNTGKGSDGRKYEYSTKPTLVSPKGLTNRQFKDLLNVFPKKKSKKKKSAFSGRDIEWRRTQRGDALILLEGGYKQLREIKYGKAKSEFVDLDGDTRPGPDKLLNSLFVIMRSTGSYKWDFYLVSISDEGKKKFANAIKRFPTLLQASDDELAIFKKGINNYFNEYLK